MKFLDILQQAEEALTELTGEKKEFSAMQQYELKNRYNWNDFNEDEAVEVIVKHVLGAQINDND